MKNFRFGWVHLNTARGPWKKTHEHLTRVHSTYPQPIWSLLEPVKVVLLTLKNAVLLGSNSLKNQKKNCLFIFFSNCAVSLFKNTSKKYSLYVEPVTTALLATALLSMGEGNTDKRKWTRSDTWPSVAGGWEGAVMFKNWQKSYAKKNGDGPLDWPMDQRTHLIESLAHD